MEKKIIIENVREEILTIAGSADLDNSQDIFKTGVLDSLNILNLITFVEKKFDLKIDPLDISLDNFCSVDSISEFVNNRLSE